ncbi:hypothetical protein D9M72_605910 [compost metagenome]
MLRDHAVEADDAVPGDGHRLLPQLPTDPLAAVFRSRDVEAEKGVAFVVSHQRDGADRPVLSIGYPVAVRIGRPEGADITEPGIPPLLGRPLDHDVEFSAAGPTDLLLHGSLLLGGQIALSSAR